MDCGRLTRVSLVLDVFELQKLLVGVAVLAAAELAAVVGEHGADLGATRLKGRPYMIIEQLDGGEGQCIGIESGSGTPAAAVDGGLQVDLADTLQDADKRRCRWRPERR